MNDDDSSFLSDNSTTSTLTKNPISPKIMLATIIVLFLAVVAITCFHSYSRWLSERRLLLLFFSTDSHGTVPRPPTAGLDVSILKSLPSFTFSSKHIPCKCTVCLSEFKEGDVSRQLPNCGHSFHLECIDKWFWSKASCPLCRAPVDWRGKEVVLTLAEDDVQATAGDLGPQSGLSRTSYSSCSCLVGQEEEGVHAEELQPEKMEERCKELENIGFCFAEGKRSENKVLSLKRIGSV